ncbi:MAG: diadenylate cyclase CdaA [Balneolales bacterium]
MELFPIGFLDFGLIDLIETIIIASILFYLYRWTRGSFAVPAFVGILIVFLVNAMVSALGLTTINFMMSRILDVGVLAVIILFQPELRKLLYSIGLNTNFDRFFGKSGSTEVTDEVIDAVKKLSRTKTGALIVFSKRSALNDLIEVGVKIDAVVSSQLLLTIFNKEAPLHDGAVIIRNNKIVAASSYLPISQNPNISSVFGTRHRAAVGVTEINNVFVVVVSEETGRISIARHGALTSGLTIQKLRQEMQEALSDEYIKEEETGFSSAEMD